MVTCTQLPKVRQHRAGPISWPHLWREQAFLLHGVSLPEGYDTMVSTEIANGLSVSTANGVELLNVLTAEPGSKGHLAG